MTEYTNLYPQREPDPVSEQGKDSFQMFLSFELGSAAVAHTAQTLRRSASRRERMQKSDQQMSYSRCGQKALKFWQSFFRRACQHLLDFLKKRDIGNFGCGGGGGVRVVQAGLGWFRRGCGSSGGVVDCSFKGVVDLQSFYY